MEETLFTKIITGKIPSEKIYEDDYTYAFLDIHPSCEGHTLVAHKTPTEFVWDLTTEEYQQLMATVHKVANHYRTVAGKQYVGINVVGTDVPHNHVHVKPFDTTAELHGRIEVTADQLEATAERLRLHD